ncbi:MAG TPA: metallopeptidase family protein [Pseudolabrys sp.]|nr:metallopeptidase family protein [Pseudolabrys sp.]
MSPHKRPSEPPPAHDRAHTPTLAEFETLAAKAYAGLPDNFRGLCEDLIIRVDDFPSREVLAHMRIASPYGLLGLFQGIGLPFRPEVTGIMPNMIWLYRQPILAYWRHSGDSLEAIVTHVLVHEIGHHFGFSDDDMEAIEAQGE